MPAPLPSFAAPPVTEVSIATRFKPLTSYSVVELGAIAQQARRAGFPNVQEMPGYDPPIERFGTVAQYGQMSLQILSGTPPTRYWFLNALGDELLQLQPNWLGANWRKVAPEAQYGRWSSRWEAFATWVEAVSDGLESSLDFEQCEVTYVNHIEPSTAWSSHSDARDIFSFLTSASGTDGFLDRPEQSLSDFKWIMTQAASEDPVGRLHVNVAPAFKAPGNTPVFVMTLIARGRPLGEGLDGVRRFADLGHEWIVRSFADLTTPLMHTTWGRIDNQDQQEGKDV